MRKLPTDRRTVMLTAGAAALAAARPGAARSLDIRGDVTFEGGVAIPHGDLGIYLEDPAIENAARRRLAESSIESDGRSKSIAFTLSLPAGATVSARLRIVARLERSDGWLIARGSTQLDAASPYHVTLNIVSY